MVELLFPSCWSHSGFHFSPFYWGNFWSLVHMALEVANQIVDGSKICFPTHLHMISLESRSSLKMRVVGEVELQSLACLEEEEALGYLSGFLIHLWKAVEE